MDFNKIIARAKAMFLAPRQEWPVIAAEPATVSGLFTGYILILAAVPVIAGFLKSSVIGTSIGFLGSFRMPMGWALEIAVMTYVLSLIGVFVSMFIVDALAPSFSAEKNQVQALKVVCYSYSAYWVASIASIIPVLGWLIALAGAIYSIYLLNMGLPFTMKNPPEKSVGYTVVIIIVTIVLYLIIGYVVNSVVGFGSMNPYRHMGSTLPGMSQPGNYAQGATGAALQAWAANVDKASKQMDAATKSGDSNAQANAVGAVLGAALGNGGKVESLAPDKIKPFLPDTLDGLRRTQMSVQRSGALGMQLSTGTATYSDGTGHTLNLEITDTGSLKGLVGFAAGYGGTEQDTETDTGYDKLYKSGGQLIHEKWDNSSHSGEYGVIVADRFSIKVSGGAAGIDELKSAATSIDQSGLAALKNDGVQASN